MTYIFITVQRDETITEITLNRPEKRNALTYEMILELTGAFQEAGDSAASGIILGAHGNVFCAGHDFADMLDQDLTHMRKLMQACSHLMQLIHQVPQPVIASVQGTAIGAGCQLALSCDMVVASEPATFRTPGGAGGWFCFTPMVAVTRAVGRKRALEMLMTGEPVPAKQAAAWGMVNRVVPPEALADETRTLMTKTIRGSRTLKGMGKHAFYSQIELDEAHAYEYAAEMMAATGIMPDPQERMRAFAEKRAPRLNQSM